MINIKIHYLLFNTINNSIVYFLIVNIDNSDNILKSVLFDNSILNEYQV